MPTIDLTDKTKKKLKNFMESEGIKTYSDAVSLLLERVSLLQLNMNRLDDRFIKRNNSKK